MPAKSIIFDAYIDAAHNAPAALARVSSLTRTQYDVILPRVLRCVPCHVKIEQRTPRGVAYLTLPDVQFDVTRHGQLYDVTEYPD